MEHLVINLYSVGALLIVVFLFSAALAPLIGQLLKGAHPPLRYVPRADPLRDARTRLAEDVHARSRAAHVLPMWDKNSGLVYPTCRERGLSLPVKARLARAAARAQSIRSNGPVGGGAA